MAKQGGGGELSIILPPGADDVTVSDAYLAS